MFVQNERQETDGDGEIRKKTLLGRQEGRSIEGERVRERQIQKGLGRQEGRGMGGRKGKTEI